MQDAPLAQLFVSSCLGQLSVSGLTHFFEYSRVAGKGGRAIHHTPGPHSQRVREISRALRKAGSRTAPPSRPFLIIGNDIQTSRASAVRKPAWDSR